MVQVGLHLCSKVLAQIPQASALSKYQGPKPPWPYKGFTSFPAFYFGANESGLEPLFEIAALKARVVSLAQMATRMATYIEVTPKTPEKRLQEGRAGEGGHLERRQLSLLHVWVGWNPDLFLHDREGRLCWDSFGNTGPYWNFSNPRVSDWILNEVASEIGREANVQAVFFDETDYLYCGGTAGNCSADVHTGEEGLAQYRAKLQLLRSLSLTLNRKKVWPIYSSYNGYSDLPWRKCLMPFDEYFNVLQDVGWIRFYEFGIGATSPSAAWDSQATLAQAMRESELGLPVMVRATPQAKLWWQEGRFGANKQPGAIRTRQISRCLRNAKSGASLPLGLFLLVQNDYWLLE
ncbi:Hypothetical protein SCF082_LOCUS13612 [Durusdinium trenchii]|uniref:Uncharacterized protein n=1 Tax=Durusdinium trenchii TaxID=1381693 RepID=A0ABP0JSE4_9DINO